MKRALSLGIELRPFEDRDHEENASVFSRLYPDFPIDADHSRHVEEERRSQVAITAMTRDERRAVGFGNIWQDRRMEYPGKYWMWTLVDAEHQGKGVGRAIYSHLAEQLSSLGAETVWANVRDDYRKDLEFVRRRGFREIWRNITLRLSLADADLGDFEQARKRVKSRGFEITTLEDEISRNPDCLRELHDLHNHIEADVPRSGYYTPITYDDFEEEFSSGTHLPDAYFLAKRNGRLVGLSYLQRSGGDPLVLEVGLTGVRKEHRRLGIAKALKLHTIHYAQSAGFRTLETGNDATNAMLSLNEKAGFRRTYSWVTFERQLDRR